MSDQQGRAGGQAVRNAVLLRGVAFPMDVRRPRRIRSEPRFGVVSPADAKPAVILRSRDEVIRGFRTQELRLELDSKPVVFTAATGSDGRFPFRHPVLLASTSVHEYLPWPESPLKVDGLDFLPAVAAAADRQWIDRMLVLRDHPQARELARQYGAQYAMRWSKEGVSVIDLETDLVMTRFLVRGLTLPQRPCPLIPGALPGDRCRMYGGPWVPSSMIASGYWMDRRYLYESELGCDQGCAPPSVRHGRVLPTRYYTWMWQSEIESQWDGLVRHVRANG